MLWHKSVGDELAWSFFERRDLINTRNEFRSHGISKLVEQSACRTDGDKIFTSDRRRNGAFFVAFMPLPMLPRTAFKVPTEAKIDQDVKIRVLSRPY